MSVHDSILSNGGVSGKPGAIQTVESPGNPGRFRLGVLTQLESQQGIPLRMELIGSRKFKLVAHLNPSGLRVSRDELVGEATVFAKVRRKFGPRETMDLFDLTSGLESMAINREQKRALKNVELPAEYRSPVKAPAAVVIPIAIYR